MEKTSVPKFASFKPKSNPGASREDGSGTRVSTGKSQAREHHSRSEKAERRQGQRDEERHRHRSRSRDEHRRRRSPERHREQHHRLKRERTPDRPQSIAHHDFEQSDLFIVDRRGDAKNVEYGSLHRYSFPAYHRFGFGHVIGSFKKIDRETSTDKEVTLAHPHVRRVRQPRPLTSKHGRMKETKLRLIAPDSTMGLLDVQGDYIELRASRKRKRGPGSPESPAYPSVDYRSIEGSAQAPTRPADEDLEYASDSDHDTGSAESGLVVRQQNAVLSKQAKAKPSELEPWLALVEHQATLVRPNGSSDVQSFNSSERKTLSDLRLSILKEASTHISKGRSGRERLLIAIIDEGAFFWDSSKLAAKWKEALSECSTSIMLWTKYLDFVQDNSTSFRYERCKDSYLQCLMLLRKAHEQNSDHDRSETGQVLIYVTLRFTTFVRDSGYDELAVSIWQALLDYHCFMPTSLLHSTKTDRLKSLEDYWDTEAPRIGEENGEGWARSTESGSNAVRNPLQPSPASLDSRTPLLSFAKEEARLQRCLSLPATTDDDAADPFRFVMSSDIREIVEHLSMELPRVDLIDAFLSFMGMPTVGNSLQRGQKDPHLSSRTRKDVVPDSDLKPSNSRQENTATLFHDAFVSAASDDADGQNWLRFLERVLELLVGVDNSDTLAEYYIAFKLHMFPDEAAKVSKRLLKAQPSSLRLYNAYALVEARLGRLDKAQDVWTTALRMRSNLGPEAQEDAVFLWHSRLLTLARKSTDAAALESLLAISETSGDARTMHLRAMRELEHGFDRLLLSEQLAHAALYADLLAWMAYLASGNDISAAFELYRKFVAKLPGNCSTAHELLLQHKSSLIKHHMDNKRSYKPAILRKDVEHSLALFPNNSMLLDLQSELTSQDRLRILIQEHKALKPANMVVVQWSYKLADELRRAGAESYGSTANTVRSTFSKALLSADSTVKHSPALWMMWLRWESGRPKSDSKARQVFLDGLRHLPWLKQWVIMGMNCLGGGEGDMRQWYEALIERGLRVRLEIDEAI